MIPADLPRAACADRLDLVDAAYDARKNGPRGRAVRLALRLECCNHCPIIDACQVDGIGDEFSHVWGAA